jgi:hypothetical protein
MLLIGYFQIRRSSENVVDRAEICFLGSVCWVQPFIYMTIPKKNGALGNDAQTVRVSKQKFFT